jgi:phosphoribosylaminoimidazolecarboxamide formyltransferase/IMP cyclohydrolase
MDLHAFVFRQDLSRRSNNAMQDVECQAYEVMPEQRDALAPSALVHLRARNPDPMCSFGDFCAVSHVFDEATDKILKQEASDGIIAPGYIPEAMELL